MDLSYLNEFVTLVDVGNYQRAADQLFIAQSALSRHIQNMEKELGVSLFTRTTRSIKLTDYGELFYPYAKSMLKLQYEYNTALYNHMNHIAGTVTIGCLPVSAPYHIPEILAKFSKENEHFSVRLTGSDDLQQLRDHKADLVFVRETGEPSDDIVYLPFDNDTLVALLPLDHPLAGKTAISLAELKEESFLFLAENSKMHLMCQRYCRAAGFEPRISYSGPHAENMIALVKEHLGVGLLTKKPLEKIPTSEIAILDITPAIHTPISLAYLKGVTPSVGALHFISCVKSFIIE
ncbi:MAG: LysR family transcriptional regulator [Lachnospiraceae bacterium]|nr:LysR family transcriptional regulator [Lachnospiraceae bacterium]